jgi:hypothetical protein
MMRLALILAVIVLAGCTGQNIDETFLSDHGVVLARVDCHAATTSPFLTYSALMFLDGSVRVDARTGDDGSGWAFFERSDSEGAHGTAAFPDASTACGAPSNSYLRIESGDLNYYICSGGPPAHVLDESLDLATDCSGFNKSLFD